MEQYVRFINGLWNKIGDIIGIMFAMFREIHNKVKNFVTSNDFVLYINGKNLYHKWLSLYSVSIPEMTLIPKIIHKNSVAFDIGANNGEFTFFISRLLPEGLVHAFEPQHKPFNILKGLCSCLNNAKPHMIGFSSSSRDAQLFIPLVKGNLSPTEASLDSHFNDYSGYERIPKAAGYVEESIHLTTIDDFCRNEIVNNLDFIKIDVEGHELEILKGGSYFLFHIHRPVLLIEIFPYVYSGHLEEVCNFLTTYNYIAFVMDEKTNNLEYLNDNNKNKSLGFNYFFIPIEKINQFDEYLSGPI
jgi:FkbM family methyltransferase